jgi:hypothetical protein
MAPELISTAYFIKLFRLYVCTFIPLTAARQRVDKHVPAATNERNRKIVHVVFCGVRVVSMGLSVYPPILARKRLL